MIPELYVLLVRAVGMRLLLWCIYISIYIPSLNASSLQDSVS